ncbi:MAG: hypothetical protein HYS59_01955 [Candidatus Vogelbacteria bacterium]|nr:hypothetical protein [Candidatus Vogelbacteria bacterium]
MAWFAFVLTLAAFLVSWCLACIKFVPEYHGAQVFLFGKPVAGFVLTAGLNVLPTPFHEIISGNSGPIDVRARTEKIPVEIVMDAGNRLDVVADVVINYEITDVGRYFLVKTNEHVDWLERHAKACAFEMLSTMSVEEALKSTKVVALRLACRLSLGYYPEEAVGGVMNDNRLAIISAWDAHCQQKLGLYEFYAVYYCDLLRHFMYWRDKLHSDIEERLGIGILDVLVKDFDFTTDTKKALEQQGQARAIAEAQDVDVESMTRNIRRIMLETGVDKATAANMVMASRDKNTSRTAFSIENAGPIAELLGKILNKRSK